MCFTSILSQVGDDDDCDARLRLAIELSLMFGCELIGVGSEAPELYLSPHGLSWPKPGYRLQGAEEDIAARLARFADRFEATPDIGKTPHRWLAAISEPAEFLSTCARGADLIVASRPHPGALSRTFASPANLVLSAGRPVLLMPRGGGSPAFDTIVVGWKDTRESRRALLDSLPFLRRARRIVIAAVNEQADRRASENAIGDVAHRLAMLGVEATPEIIEPGHDGAASALIGFAQREAAGLLVAGAYGHSRLRELVLGGFTEWLLEAPHAVLFSH